MIFEISIFLKNAAILFFSWSYEIGKLIVSLLCFVTRSLYACSAKLSNLLHIVVGDFQLFVQDVNGQSSYIVNTVFEAYKFCLWIVDQVILCFIRNFTRIVHGIRDFFSNSYNSFEDSVIFTNRLIKQIGPALWLLIKLPYTVFHSIVHCIYNLHEFHVVVTSFFRELYFSLTKVSIESILGIVFFSVFVYLLIKFRRFFGIIGRSLILIFLYNMNLRISKFSLKRFWTRSVGVPSKSKKTEHGDESYLCIICQSNPRCVVLMPCKHLCLCNKCSDTLVRYQSTNCPICRQVTSFKIKVYL